MEHFGTARLFAALAALLLSLTVATAANNNTLKRRVGWWWDAPGAADDPEVDALLAWVGAHTDITTSILMRCGPSTQTGRIAGALSPACARAIPELAKLGVESELWLGETDSRSAALQLVGDPAGAVAALVAIGTAHPGIAGVNFDLEVSNSTAADAPAYAQFLEQVRAGLAAAAAAGPGGVSAPPIRVTTDASCSGDGQGWAPIMGNCSLLAHAADKVMHMATYNSNSYPAWLAALAPAVAPGVPRGRVGAGLGCFVNAQLNNTWSLTPESAALRVCALMNYSFTEIDMFRVAPHTEGWPAPYWIPQLQKFMAGGGCALPAPSVQCPAPGWAPGDWPHDGEPASCIKALEGLCAKCLVSEACWESCARKNAQQLLKAGCVKPGGNCCTVRTPAGCAAGLGHEQCAQQQCEHSRTAIATWVPLDFSHHPYTCCARPPPVITRVAA